MDTENEENTPDQKALLAAEEALDTAGAPRTDTQRDGIGINLELSLASRIQWLSQMFAAQSQRAEGAERNLSELHIELRRACAAESVSEALERIYALRGAQEKLDYFVSKRDADVAALEAEFKEQRDDAVRDCEFFKKQADDAIVSLRNVTFDRERWKSQCVVHERTIHELAAKVDAFKKKNKKRTAPKTAKPKSKSKSKKG